MNPPDGRVYTARSDIYLGSFTFDAAGGEIKTHSQAGVRGQRFLFFDGRAASWPLVLSSYQDLSCETLRNVSLMVTQDAQDDSLSEGACPHPPPLSTNRTRTPPLLSTNRTRTPPLLSTSRTQTSREHHCLQLPTVAPIHVPTVPSREHHCLQLPRSRVEVLFAQAAACPISTG